ncbi:MAG: hypothetical protein KTR25_13390 [Myxococcales bacterium]|nr:hypothetical protein [Myxococcales bacterium]
MVDVPNDPATTECFASTNLSTTPASFAHAIVIDVIHDGDQLQLPTPVAARSDVRHAFHALRAHGTRDFANELHNQLGTGGVVALSLARITLDLDQLPGIDMGGRSRALGTPVAPLVSIETRRQLIHTYRALLTHVARARQGARLWISIRSRDEPSDTLRVRFIASPPPHAGHDPLIPRDIFSQLCKPSLPQAISRAMGTNIDPAGHIPPLLSTSMAARALTFDWIKYLQTRLEEYGPAKNEIWDDARRILWAALLDTSGISVETHSVNSYLHHQLEAPPIYREKFEAMAERYVQAQRWVASQSNHLVEEFFRWHGRQHGLVIELPVPFQSRHSKQWAKHLADGIHAGFSS